MKIIINLKGDSIYFDKKIEILKDITETTTIMNIRIYIKKLYKLPKNFNFYLYIIPEDLFCGFCPTPEHKIIDLVNLFGNDNIINMVATEKNYFG